MIPTAGVFVSCINLQTTQLCKQVYYSFLSVTFTIIAVDSGNTVQCTDVHTCFPLKGPKHDQVECGYFYTNQTRMVR